MGSIEMNYGKPSYTIGNNTVRVYSTIQGGHTTASFKADGKTMFPYFVSPWWNEAPIDNLPSTMQVLRGDYFCFPFGVNDEPVGGKKQPLHGVTANGCWEFDGIVRERESISMTLHLELSPDDGMVKKKIRIVENEPTVYLEHTISGFTGRSPVAHHPCIQCSLETGSAFVDMSEPLVAFTPPFPLGSPDKQGYSLLKPNTRITDRKKVPTVHGESVDTTRYPLPRGYEDAIMYISDPAKDFCFSSVAVPEKGFLYFHLKDPRTLNGSLFWMPNGGAYSPPLNGRMLGVIGLEEITGYYFYGRKPSMDPNPLSELGYSTCLDFNAASPSRIRFIASTVPIGKDFQGVKDIIRKDEHSVTILGRGGEKMDVACAVDFLKD